MWGIMWQAIMNDIPLADLGLAGADEGMPHGVVASHRGGASARDGAGGGDSTGAGGAEGGDNGGGGVDGGSSVTAPWRGADVTCSTSIGALPDAQPPAVLDELGRVKSEPLLAPYEPTREKSPTRGQMLVCTPGALAAPSMATEKP